MGEGQGGRGPFQTSFPGPLLPILEYPCLDPTPQSLLSSSAGPYTLSFLYTGLSKPSVGFPSFQAIAYLNDQAFFHYDSNSRKAEPLGPWIQVEGMEDWEKESQLQRAREDIFMETLKDIMDYYKDGTGSHTFQGVFGCELRSDKSRGAFWRYAYDGRDFIEFNKETPAWVPLDPAAVNTKQKWESEPVFVLTARAYLEEECPKMLKRYLQYAKKYLDRRGTYRFLCPLPAPPTEKGQGLQSHARPSTDPPTVSLSSHAAPGRTRTLKCLAYDFYPRGIRLHWTRDGATRKTKSEGVVLPSGNGTYQSWVEVEVPPQVTAPNACHVEHISLAQPLAVLWDKKQGAKAGRDAGTQSQ
ncbi:Zinc-alpha-2-glycoprotein [Galemys pyrenaicus]|uniref:Zinc-alpha-2-glycoprotein n=1 Tax=Galemys pyrenaicus TaxID=202257 RepID=A0A8J6AT33_GALPY|nr:Zinc-alpha-2-glycoprotein [Galemys pyrenaicus]